MGGLVIAVANPKIHPTPRAPLIHLQAPFGNLTQNLKLGTSETTASRVRRRPAPTRKTPRSPDCHMPSPSFSSRTEYVSPWKIPKPIYRQPSERTAYRAATRSAFNSVGTEGSRAPGNIPRTYGLLNSEIQPHGANIPTPTGKVRQPYDGWASPEKITALSAITDKSYYQESSTGWQRWPAPMQPGEPTWWTGATMHGIK